MKLYHVSADTDILKRCFEPRIPELSRKAVEIEDVTTPRICFSETVSGCISALPKYSRNKVAVEGGKFVLYEIDTAQFAAKDFVSNSTLVKTKSVYDANITKEWWLLKPITLKGKLCEVVSVTALPLPSPLLVQDVRAWNYLIVYRELS